MAHLVHNEKVKLTATAFNTSAVACFVVGVLTPVAATVARGVPMQRPDMTSIGSPGVVSWLGVGIIPHLLARSMLGRLRE
jgi:MFS-type transporter involved in bile tolerance (Atg22 family)